MITIGSKILFYYDKTHRNVCKSCNFSGFIIAKAINETNFIRDTLNFFCYDKELNVNNDNVCRWNLLNHKDYIYGEIDYKEICSVL